MLMNFSTPGSLMHTEIVKGYQVRITRRQLRKLISEAMVYPSVDPTLDDDLEVLARTGDKETRVSASELAASLGYTGDYATDIETYPLLRFAGSLGEHGWLVYYLDEDHLNALANLKGRTVSVSFSPSSYRENFGFVDVMQVDTPGQHFVNWIIWLTPADVMKMILQVGYKDRHMSKNDWNGKWGEKESDGFIKVYDAVFSLAQSVEIEADYLDDLSVANVEVRTTNPGAKRTPIKCVTLIKDLDPMFRKHYDSGKLIIKGFNYYDKSCPVVMRNKL